MFNKGDIVEFNARTGNTLPNGNPERAWKRGKVLANRRAQSGKRQYQIDGMTGKPALWFDDTHVRAIPGVTPTRAIPTYRPQSAPVAPAKKISDFPHKCPNCKGPAYVPPTPGGRVDCQAKCSVDPYIKPEKPKKARMY